MSLNYVECLEQENNRSYTWLNATYGERNSSFSKNSSTEKSSTGLFAKAFQIETGTRKYRDAITKSLSFSTLQIGDEGNRVKLIQCALSFKGYYSRAISGKFDNETAVAVKKLKYDALGCDTSDASVNLLWFAAILCDNSYECNKNCDRNIRKIQQYLNRKYHSHCGIISCDGRYSKQTNKMLIMALQHELDCEIDGTFGRDTTKKCPTLTQGMRGKLIYLLQCSLYVNGFRSMIDGIYSKKLSDNIKSFQNFVKLPVTGTADMSTLKSMLVSSGDYLRPAIACDCATQLTLTKAKALRRAGYRYVGRYLTGNICNRSPKFLTKKEFIAISVAGMRVFPIYQDGGHKLIHFTIKNGIDDAKKALKVAHALCFPRGTIIYFAVDCDPSDEQLLNSVIPYFKAVFETIAKSKSGYLLGVYGTRNTCSTISRAGYATTSFVGGISSNFNGNLGYPLPKNWAFDQFHELKGIDKFRCEEGGFNIDKNAFSGRDNGVYAVVK